MKRPLSRNAVPDPNWRRASRRVPVDMTVSGRVPATPITAHILNLSATGCLVESRDIDRVARGATILLTMSTEVEVAGQVVWISGERFGVRFREPTAMAEQLLMAMCERARA